MEYRPLGHTGVSVSQMCLGAMMFGAFGNPDHDDAAKIIHKALDAGINFIDTADGYSAGESEEILGQALAGGRRESVVLVLGVPLGLAAGRLAWNLAASDFGVPSVVITPWPALAAASAGTLAAAAAIAAGPATFATRLYPAAFLRSE
jgi:hypothetical protein